MAKVLVTIQFPLELDPAWYDDGETLQGMCEVEREAIMRKDFLLNEYVDDETKLTVSVVPVEVENGS